MSLFRPNTTIFWTSLAQLGVVNYSIYLFSEQNVSLCSIPVSVSVPKTFSVAGDRTQGCFIRAFSTLFFQEIIISCLFVSSLDF